VLLAGGGYRHGQYLAFDAERNRPLSDLFLTVAHSLGIKAEQFSSSSGVLSWE